jgi:hypothetical protein
LHDELSTERLDEHVGTCGCRETLHGEISGPFQLQEPGAAAARDPYIADLLCMFGVEGVGDAEQRRQLADDQSILAIESDVRQMALFRGSTTMIAGDIRDDCRFVGRQSEDLRFRQDVLGVLVVRAQADVEAHVVQQRGDLEEPSRAVAEAVFFAECIEQASGQVRDVKTVLAIQPVSLPQRLGMS